MKTEIQMILTSDVHLGSSFCELWEIFALFVGKGK